MIVDDVVDAHFQFIAITAGVGIDTRELRVGLDFPDPHVRVDEIEKCDTERFAAEHPEVIGVPSPGKYRVVVVGIEVLVLAIERENADVVEDFLAEDVYHQSSVVARIRL